MLQRAAMLVASVLLSSAIFTINSDGQSRKTDKDVDVSESPVAMAKQLTEPKDTILALTEQDFLEVAQSLGVEVAAIKAVVEIEAGFTHEGFSAPGKPLINFDLTMFRRFAKRHGVNLSKYGKSHSVVFNSHRGSQLRANRRLEAAKTIHPQAAVEGTLGDVPDRRFQLEKVWSREPGELCGTYVAFRTRSARHVCKFHHEHRTGKASPVQKLGRICTWI